ncbi:MAG: hypothetical protein HY980_00080 [Candidatus Magasanikbacteria bacterium]|nr:hypothetical protein [Candidatus Magasanikbacteria bacterium]
MRSFWKLFFVFFVIAVFFIRADAANALSLVPALIDVEAEVGELLTQKIALFNETDQPLIVYPTVENFQSQAGTSAPQFLGDNDPLGAARWISAPAEGVALAPRDSVDVLVEIEVPDTAEPGGHYTALFWSEEPLKEAGISTASRVGALFLFKIRGEIKEAARIISFQKRQDGWPVEFVLRLQNDGNAHIKPSGTVEIVNWRGKIVAELPINSKGQSILPQSQKDFLVSWAGEHPTFGWYSARVNIIYGIAVKTLEARVNFWLLPASLGNKILGVVLITFLAWLILKMARRRAHLILILLVSLCLVAPCWAVTTSTSGATTVSASISNPSSGGGCGGECGVGDIIAPAAVADLTAGSPTPSSITLNWTAPGDDGNVGTALHYDIRYSSLNITDENWVAATQLIDEPAPQVAGSSQSTVASGLSADTNYYFALKAADEVPNWSALSNVVSLKTLSSPDTTPPVIDLIIAKASVTSAEIFWHTNEQSDSQVAYGLTKQLGSLSADSELVINHKLVLTNLTPNTTYYFKVISTDAGGNQAVGLQGGVEIGQFKTKKDTTPPANVSNFQAEAGDKEVLLSWQNPTDNDFAGVWIFRSVADYPKSPAEGKEIANVGKDTLIFNDSYVNNGTVYYYTAFAYDVYKNYASGAIDKATPQAGLPPPEKDGQLPPPEDENQPPPGDQDKQSGDGEPGGPPPQGAAPGSESGNAGVGGSGGSYVEGLQLGNFIFSAAKGQIVVPTGFQMDTLVGSTFGVALPKDHAPKAIESIILHVAGSSYLFNFSESQQMWQTEFVAPTTPGVYQAALSISFVDQTGGAINWQLQSLPYGQVYEKSAGQKKPLAGATVSLLQQDKLWPAYSFFQSNPQTTGADGAFGFLAPSGEYSLEIKKDGYATEKIGISIAGAVINSSVELLYLPPAIKDVIKPGAPLAENVLAVVQNLGEKGVFISKKVWGNAKKIANDPEVQKAAEEVAAPAVTGVAAAGATAAIGWAQLLRYLRFLFTQPALLLKRRKRHGWGVIYNSLTKLPLGLVIVRLVDLRSNRIVQTRVTDSNGRYIFFPALGSYRLEINANQFQFPSRLLVDLKQDGVFLDLYHGEPIEVKEVGAALTANIPLDPSGAELPVRRLVWHLALRRLQHAFSIFSLILALVFVVWVPSILTAGLLAAQVVFYGLFLRLAIPRKPKGWGIIYDEKTRLPLARAVARIFDKQYNKLLETQITDKTGRYSFLVGRNKYYVSYEKDGYEKKQSEVIDLADNREPVASVGIDTNLKPADNNDATVDNQIKKTV